VESQYACLFSSETSDGGVGGAHLARCSVGLWTSRDRGRWRYILMLSSFSLRLYQRSRTTASKLGTDDTYMLNNMCAWNRSSSIAPHPLSTSFFRSGRWSSQFNKLASASCTIGSDKSPLKLAAAKATPRIRATSMRYVKEEYETSSSAKSLSS